MNSLLRRIYATGFVEDAEGKLVSAFPSGVLYETGLILYDLIRQTKPRQTLEVGMGYGLSMLFICQAHHDNDGGCHIAIDPAQEWRYKSIGVLNARRADLDHLLTFYQAPSFETLPRLLAEGRQVDLAFIDGRHQFDYTLVDFFYVDLLLRVNGLVVFDDLWMPSVRRVISFVLTNRTYRRVMLPSKRQIPLWRRAGTFARRFLQDPFERNYWLKLVPENVCILQKTAEDKRAWTFHRLF